MNHLASLVEDLQVQRIRDGALAILSEVGMAVPSDQVRRRLARAGLRVAQKRVFVDTQRSEAFLERQRAQQRPEDSEAPPRLHSGSHALYHFDPEGACVRRLTVRDLERYTRLLGALQQQQMLVAAACPGQPSDVPRRLALLWQQYLSARWLPDPPLCAYSLPDAPYICEMAQILGKQVSFGVHPISPLTLGGDEFDLALRLIDDGALQTVAVAPMPIMGVTAPLDWAAAWAQALAEAVGAAIALEALGAARAHPFAALYAADMRTGGLVYGSPEHALITLTEARVNRELLGNARRAAKSLNTTAKTPGAHAAAEKAAHTLLALLAGYRHLSGLGVLAVDEIFSPQQVFLDFDIVGHAWRVARGLAPQYEGGDAVSLVREGEAPAEHFLGAPATLSRFRDFYWSPRLLDRRPTQAWLRDPTDALDRARQLAAQLAADYDYQLDDDRDRALRGVIERAQKVLC